MNFTRFLAVDKNGDEGIYEGYPNRNTALGAWFPTTDVYEQAAPAYIELPTGSIERLIGRKLTWEDDAVEFNNVC